MSVRTFGALAASAVLVVAGALVGGTAGAAPHVDRAAASVAVDIDANRNVTMPATIQPGVNTFRITSAKPSLFQLVMPAEGYTQEQAAADIEAGLNKSNVKALKRFEKNVTLYGGAMSTPERPGKLVTRLPAGDYWALDVYRKVTKFASVTVAGAETGLSMPKSPTIKAVDSITWAKRPASIPRKGMLTFKNRADENHFLVLAKLKPGKTIQDVEAYIANGFKGPDPVDFRHSLDTGVISPGQTEVVNYKLPRGNYLMVCFWPDDSKGMPHAMMGMLRGIRLR